MSTDLPSRPAAEDNLFEEMAETPSRPVDDDPWSTAFVAPSSRKVEEPEELKFVPCPMCGKEVAETATECRACGERLSTAALGSAVVPTSVSPGRVLSVTWQLFSQEWGSVISASFIAGLVTGVLGQILSLVLEAVDSGPGSEFVIVLVILPVVVLPQLLLHVFMSLGLSSYLLMVIRGASPQSHVLFSAGKYLGRAVLIEFLLLMLMGTLAAGLSIPLMILGFSQRWNPVLTVIAAGGLACLPSAYVQMRFMPVFYYLVEQNSGPIEALQETWALTGRNHLTQFVVVVLMLAVCGTSGLLACVVGLIPAMAFYTLLQAVAYVLMCGRKVRVE